MSLIKNLLLSLAALWALATSALAVTPVQGAALSTDVRPITVHFGDHTAAGAGAAVVLGARIVSGDPLGYFVVGNNSLTLTPAGVGMHACTAGRVCEVIVTNAGQKISVVKDANTYDVANQTDWNNVTTGPNSTAANLGGKYIEMRPGIIITCNINDFTSGRNSLLAQDYYSYGGVVVEARDLNKKTTCNDTPGKYGSLISISSSGLTLRGFIFPTGKQPLDFDSDYRHLSHITLDQDVFTGLTKDPNGDYSGRFRNFRIGTGDGVTRTFNYTAVDNDGHNLPVNIDGSSCSFCTPYGFSVKAGSVTGSDSQTGNVTGTGIVTGSGATNSSCASAVAGTSYVCYDRSGSNVGKISITFTSPPAAGAPITVNYNVNGGVMWQNTDGIHGQGADYCDITITNNTFTYFSKAINLSGCGNIIISGNHINIFYAEAVQISIPGGGRQRKLTFDDNYITQPVAIPTDNGNPHTDALQVAAPNITGISGDWPIEIDRNVVIHGNSRGASLGMNAGGFTAPRSIYANNSTMRGSTITTTNNPAWTVGMIISGRGVPNQTHIIGGSGNSWTVSTSLASPITTNMVGVPDSGYFYTGEAIGNIIDFGSGDNIAIAQAKNFKVWNNTSVGRNNSGASGCTAHCDQDGTIVVGDSSDINAPGHTSAGTLDIERNVTEGLRWGATGQVTTAANVVLITHASGPPHFVYNYCQVFAGGQLGATCASPLEPIWNPTTPAQAFKVFAPKTTAGAQLLPATTGQTYPVGALGSPAPITFVAQPGSGGINNAH